MLSENSTISMNGLFNQKSSDINDKNDWQIQFIFLDCCYVIFSVLVKKYHEGSFVTLCISQRSKGRVQFSPCSAMFWVDSLRMFFPQGDISLSGDFSERCKKRDILFFSLFFNFNIYVSSFSFPALQGRKWVMEHVTQQLNLLSALCARSQFSPLPNEIGTIPLANIQDGRLRATN